MQLSGGPFTYNRFDEYEKSLQEKKLDPVGKEDADVDNDGDVDSSDSYLKKRREAIGKAMASGGDKKKGASSPGEMAKKTREAGRKNKARGAALEKADKKGEEKEEKETADVSEAVYGGSKPEPKKDKKMLVTNVDKRGGTPAYKNMKAGDPRYKAADHMGESFFIEDEEGNIYEGKKDACYHKVKSRYDVWPSAYASGALVKCRKKGAANWGKSDKKEMFDEFGHEYIIQEGSVTPGADLAQRKLNKDANNSKLKVTKAVMEQEQRMAMYSRALGIMGSHYSGQPLAEKESTDERKSAADKSAERDRQEKEGKYKDAAESEAKMKKQDKELAKEDVQLTKEMVVDYLVNEGYANNEVSAEILHQHISDEFLEEIEERMISEMGPAFPSETKAQAKAQGDHRSGKSSAGLKTGKNPGLKASHTSGANKQA